MEVECVLDPAPKGPPRPKALRTALAVSATTARRTGGVERLGGRPRDPGPACGQGRTPFSCAACAARLVNVKATATPTHPQMPMTCGGKQRWSHGATKVSASQAPTPPRPVGAATGTPPPPGDQLPRVAPARGRQRGGRRAAHPPAQRHHRRQCCSGRHRCRRRPPLQPRPPAEAARSA
ncbi:hypothetical protein I4F81_001859 [Pyropia yezoensis]|uniref:Uncharacterized protein n=1 Tax=Pyropia yezoensis TaxID=2788 RepID=A0ACC3BMY3_PYRYE|nr:hypothetical protein I4F81_001859 [Neopyropia yezoensis]